MAPQVLERSQIWQVNFERGARGNEDGAKRVKGRLRPVRPSLVVSRTAYNANSDRVTVVPLITPKYGSQEHRNNWSVRIETKDIVRNTGDYLHERLSDAPRDRLIDCARIHTVDAPRNLADIDRRKFRGGVIFADGGGTLPDLPQIQIALQVVLSSDIRVKSTDLPFAQGDVVEEDLADGRTRRFVIVSSTAVDTWRHVLTCPRDDGTESPLDLTTVVPLVPVSSTSLRMGAPSDAYPIRIRETDHFAVHCEPRTYDWTSRKLRRIESLPSRDRTEVLLRLRTYLGLPDAGEK